MVAYCTPHAIDPAPNVWAHSLKCFPPDVRAKIADLKRMERVLKNVVAQCADGTLPECPLIETLFAERK